MANDNHKELNKDELLTILAKKMGTRRRDVDFLFGKKPLDEKSVKIPGFRETLHKKV